MTKHLTTEQFDFLKYHCGNDLEFDQSNEIKLVRVLKADKIKYFKNGNPWLLILFSNDFIDFTEKGIRENHITFYTINLKSTKRTFLIAIEFIFFENGTKKETRLFLKPINSFLNNLISSKYNIVNKQ